MVAAVVEVVETGVASSPPLQAAAASTTDAATAARGTMARRGRDPNVMMAKV